MISPFYSSPPLIQPLLFCPADHISVYERGSRPSYRARPDFLICAGIPLFILFLFFSPPCITSLADWQTDAIPAYVVYIRKRKSAIWERTNKYIYIYICKVLYHISWRKEKIHEICNYPIWTNSSNMYGDFLVISSLPSFSPYFPLLDRRGETKTCLEKPFPFPHFSALREKVPCLLFLSPFLLCVWYLYRG